MAVSMRRADERTPDTYLLEEVAHPRASVKSSRISLWIYREGPIIREVVLSGHAESGTCRRATTAIIRAVAQLDGVAEWMLTCGAAFIRVRDTGPVERANAGQATLAEMVRSFGELAEETGLVELVEQEWQALRDFRACFDRRRKGTPEIVLPDRSSPGLIADYLPVVPDANPDGPPLIFTLEGWDFDCPEFQAVAELHLRNLQREMLRDALRRRGTYREWLREWVERWVFESAWLPESEANTLALRVPPPFRNPDEQAGAELGPKTVGIAAFLEYHAAGFLDRSQDWNIGLARVRPQLRYGQLPEADLAAPIRPETIREIDFERGIYRIREATGADTFTRRDRVKINDPVLITQCLEYIRRMDYFIRPYEDLGLRARRRMRGPSADASPPAREVAATEEISRRVVLETMIRGWPSIYMPDERDQEVFDKWAGRCRRQVWRKMNRQAKAAGIKADLLLEDNIVYEIRFNTDLGCTVQPLMLVDDASHVQLHGTRAGASVVLPLWPRRKSKALGEDLLQLGPGNRERAAALVEQARAAASGPQSDPRRAAAILRLALACHPGEAGSRILTEWARRLGRDTSVEFASARHIATAAELAARFRYTEARSEAEAYLGVERDPVADAYVIAALATLVPEQEYRQQHEIIQKDKRIRAKAPEAKDSGWTAEADRLRGDYERVTATIEAAEQERKRLIEEALTGSDSIRREHPALARAAERAPLELRAALERHGLHRQSEAMISRYADIGKIVEVRTLFDAAFELSSIHARVQWEPNQARHEALDRMSRLARTPWLLGDVETDLKLTAEEFGKGDWDRLQANQIAHLLSQAITSCVTRIRDVLADRVVRGAPLAEASMTRIHVTQLMLGQYNTALQMLLDERVPLGRAVAVPWELCDRTIAEFPAGGRLTFEPASGTILLEAAGERHALLRAPNLSASERDFVSQAISDAQLPSRISRFAPSVAEGLLPIDLEPNRGWRSWRDAMAALRPELLFAFSNFSHEVAPVREAAPRLTAKGEKFMRRLDSLTPHDSPELDWEWAVPGSWSRWIPRGTGRVPLRERADAGVAH